MKWQIRCNSVDLDWDPEVTEASTVHWRLKLANKIGIHQTVAKSDFLKSLMLARVGRLIIKYAGMLIGLFSSEYSFTNEDGIKAAYEMVTHALVRKDKFVRLELGMEELDGILTSSKQVHESTLIFLLQKAVEIQHLPN